MTSFNRRAHLRSDFKDLAAARGVELVMAAQSGLHGAQNSIVLVGLAVAKVHAHAELVMLHRRARDSRHPARAGSRSVAESSQLGPLWP